MLQENGGGGGNRHHEGYNAFNNIYLYMSKKARFVFEAKKCTLECY